MSNKRIFVRKREGYNKEELQLKESLNVEYSLGLDSVEIYVIYDIYNIDEETYKLAKTSVFSEVVSFSSSPAAGVKTVVSSVPSFIVFWIFSEVAAVFVVSSFEFGYAFKCTSFGTSDWLTFSTLLTAYDNWHKKSATIIIWELWKLVFGEKFK